MTLPNLQVGETRPLATVSSIPVEDMKAPGSETKDGVFLRARELGRVSAFCVTASCPSSHRQTESGPGDAYVRSRLHYGEKPGLRGRGSFIMGSKCACSLLPREILCLSSNTTHYTNTLTKTIQN